MAKKVFKIAAALDPLEFEIDGDTFTAIAPNRLPGNVLIEYVENIQSGKVYQGHKEFFERALLPESAERFNSRLNDPANPIPLQQMIEVAEWLTVEYSAFTVGGTK
jgi:hypothetical protein